MNKWKRRFSKLAFILRNFSSVFPGFSHILNEVYDNKLALLANQSGSDKGPGNHNYTRIYRKFLEPLRNEQVNILEIGLLKHSVQRKEKKDVWGDAPSLDMWSKYFKNADIIGFDIADFSDYRKARCRVVQGDQSSKRDLNKISELLKGGKIDVIIDDALHHVKHQQISLSTLFPLLKSGGLYFIEDLHFDPLPGRDANDSMANFLRTIQSNSVEKTYYLNESEVGELKQSIKCIRFFDSSRIDLCGRDALAVISKK